MKQQTIVTTITNITTYIKLVNSKLSQESLSIEDIEEMEDLIDDLVIFEEKRKWEGIKIFDESNKMKDYLSEISEAFSVLQKILQKLINTSNIKNEQMIIHLKDIPKTLPEDRNIEQIFIVKSKSLLEFYLETIEKIEKINEDIQILSVAEIHKAKINSVAISHKDIILYEEVREQLQHYHDFSKQVIYLFDALCEKIQIIKEFYFKYNYINKLYPKKYLISREIIENKAKVLYTEKMELSTSELSGWIICANKDEIKKKNDKSFFKSLTASQICELSEEKKFYNERIFELLLDIYKMPYGTKIEWHYHKEGWIDKLIDLNTNNDVDFPADESIEEINKIVELP